MNGDLASPVTWAAGAGALAYLFVKVKARLELSKAKHPSLRGHARMSRLAAKLVPFYDYDEEAFFSSDDAPPEIVARRSRRHGGSRSRPRPASPICSSPPRTAFRSSIEPSSGGT